MGLEEGGRNRITAMWYLVGLPSYKNLGEEVEGLLARHLGIKHRKKVQETLEEHIPIEHATRSVRRSPKVMRLQQAYREERLARYEQVIALRKLGMSQAAIAKRVGIGQSTIGNWLAAGAYPETIRGPYAHELRNEIAVSKQAIEGKAWTKGEKSCKKREKGVSLEGRQNQCTSS